MHHHPNLVTSMIWAEIEEGWREMINMRVGVILFGRIHVWFLVRFDYMRQSTIIDKYPAKFISLVLKFRKL